MGSLPCGPLTPYIEHYITLLRELGYGPRPMSAAKVKDEKKDAHR